MPKFFSDAHLSGTSTDLTIDGNIIQDSTYNLTISSGSNIVGGNHLLLKGNASYVKIHSPNNSIYYDASAHYLRNGAGSANYLLLNSSGATFGGIVGMGSTGIYAGTNAQLNLPGKGLAIKNDKNGSNNNWSYIENTATGSASNINFYTGNNAAALTLAHSGDATFTGTVTATHFYGDGSNLTNVTAGAHNHDDRYYTETESRAKFTSTDASEDNYTFEIEDASNFSGNKWYHVATINSHNGGLHIRGAILNHVENFASQKLDIAIQVREAGSGANVEINGTVDVFHNNTTGTDKAGVRVIQTSTANANYQDYKVYVRTTRYSQLTLRLTQQGSVTFNTNHSSPLTSEPAPVSGGKMELDTSTLLEGHHVIVDSEAKLTVASSSVAITGRINSYNEAGNQAKGLLSIRKIRDNQQKYAMNSYSQGMAVFTTEDNNAFPGYGTRGVTALSLGNTPVHPTSSASSGKDLFNISRVNMGGYTPSSGLGNFSKVLNLRGNGDLYLGHTSAVGSVYATKYYDKATTAYYLDLSSTSVVNHMDMDTGNTSGKFAVMSASVHGSYDFYNNGTSYFNGAVTVDDNLSVTSGGLTISGSVDSGGTDMGYYQSVGTNIILKGDSNGRSGIFFESEKDGTNINDPSDYGFIQFHAYGYGNTSGESAVMVIGVANDNADKLVLQTPYSDGVLVGYKDGTSGTGLTLKKVFHEGHLPTLSELGAAASSHTHSISNISGLQTSLDGKAYLDHIRSLGTQASTGGSSTTITTADFISEIEADGAFDSYSSVFKNSWSYAGNKDLSDAGRFTETAGASFLTWTDNSSDTARGNITVLAVAPNTGGSSNKVFIYNDQGSGYAPGWREIWTSASDGAGSGLDADKLDGQEGSHYLDYSNFTGTPTIPTNSTFVDLSNTQTVTGNKNFSNTGNQFNGHLYYNAYDAAGNHYPHFRDGSSNSGTTINWRQYYGSSLKTHTWVSDSNGDMVFTYQGNIRAADGAYYGSSTGEYMAPSGTSVINALKFKNSTNNATFAPGSSEWGVRLTTDSGYILLGPANANHAHIYTDRPNFYFNKSILILGSTVATNDNTVTFTNKSGNISQWTNDSNYATTSHNHDDRYYTETESDAKYLLNTSDTLSGDLIIDNGTSSTLSVKCDDGGQAMIRANGDNQGTGVIEVGQGNSYGGGISYNGDGSPAFVSGESNDHITFYRMDAGVRTEVFHYGYSNSTVNFNLVPTFAGTTAPQQNFDNTGELRAINFKTLNGGNSYFYTGSGNLRGYIAAQEVDDAHFVIATSGGEDIAFKDGGPSGTTNLISRGGGDLWLRGAIQNGTIAYSQVTGTPTIPANNNQLTNGAGYVTSSSLGVDCTFSSDSANGDDMTTRKASGFYETASPTGAEGWPTNTQTGSTGWMHLLSATHSNDSNYYAMQIAGGFFNQGLYHRNTNSSGTTAWQRITKHNDTLVIAGEWLRADKFYTYNDTTRYVDPANTSLMNNVSIYGVLDLAGVGNSPKDTGTGGGTGSGSGKLLGYSALSSGGRASASLGVNDQGVIMEFEKIFTFKVSGSGWLNRSTNAYKLIQAPGADKMLIIDEFMVYIDYETRTGIGSSGIAYHADSTAYSIGFFENETGQQNMTGANFVVGGSYFTLGIMPRDFMAASTSDRGFYQDVPKTKSRVLPNRSLFWKTMRNCASTGNAPGGAHYIKIKYRILDISEEFNAAGCNHIVDSSSYHGRYAHNADLLKTHNDAGGAVL